MKKRIILWIALLPGVAAQAQTLHRTECPLGYDQYIGRVWRENLSYAAEKLNVRIADAEVKAAGVFNDPQFGVEYGNNADRRMQMGQSVSAELSKTFSPGKRAARIDLARSEQELSGALLEDYFRNLRAEATLAYLDAVKQAELFRVKQDAYENIRKLAEGDSVKYTLGTITRASGAYRPAQRFFRAEFADGDLRPRYALRAVGLVAHAGTDVRSRSARTVRAGQPSRPGRRAERHGGCPACADGSPARTEYGFRRIARCEP